ncbi:UL16-binding protein 3-like [Cebus imitator]|uniref:UL16-binding protein 3-like n=1 Tax=Cebus imitator TaxID=2715852 RepID=UPI00189AAA14|nr:UL16-binding protein 3-like [Cebus imitator]
MDTLVTHDAHFLCYNFTIIHLLRPGQQWCEVQGQVDQKNFLSYDCGTDKVLSVGRLEEQLNATDGWGRQLEMLREVGQRLRLELPGIELEDFTPSGPIRLQARMSCECEADGHIHGSWQFGFHGQRFLLFDSNNRKWTVVHAGARRMKQKWEEDRELTAFFRKVSTGDCRSWLRDFLMCREKRLEPTAPPTVSSGTDQLRAPATTLMLCCLCLILPCFLLPGI